MAGKAHWPYWPSLILAVLAGTLAGTVVELAVIRRLFKAPRVIVLVATIGVAELARAVTLTLPDYRTGSLQTAYPTPITGEWHIGSVTIEGAQLLVLIVVPIITADSGGCSVTPASASRCARRASNSDLARLTGISPKLVSTAIWTHRRVPLGGLGHPLRHRAGIVRPRVDRPRDAAARPVGRADRRG